MKSFILVVYICSLFGFVSLFLSSWQKINNPNLPDVYKLKDIQRVKKHFLFNVLSCILLVISKESMVCKAIINYLFIETAFNLKNADQIVALIVVISILLRIFVFLTILSKLQSHSNILRGGNKTIKLNEHLVFIGFIVFEL